MTEREQFVLRKVSPDELPGLMGAWDVTGDSNKTYRVTIYDPDGETATCTCPSWRIRRQRCKHINAVYEEIIK